MENTKQSKKQPGTQEAPEADPKDNNKVYKTLQENLVSDQEENYKKSSNRARTVYPRSKSMPVIDIIYTSNDQVT